MKIELKFYSGEVVKLKVPFIDFPKELLNDLSQEGECVTLQFGTENWTVKSPVKLPRLAFLKSARIIK